MPYPVGACHPLGHNVSGIVSGAVYGVVLGVVHADDPVEGVEHARHCTSRGIVAAGRHKGMNAWIRK